MTQNNSCGTSGSGSGHSATFWKTAYMSLYALGTVLSFIMLALLAWIAYCIAIEAEPLAAITILSNLPVAVIFLILLVILVACCAAWQYGAHCHQQYENSKQ